MKININDRNDLLEAIKKNNLIELESENFNNSSYEYSGDLELEKLLLTYKDDSIDQLIHSRTLIDEKNKSSKRISTKFNFFPEPLTISFPLHVESTLSYVEENISGCSKVSTNCKEIIFKECKRIRPSEDQSTYGITYLCDSSKLIYKPNCTLKANHYSDISYITYIIALKNKYIVHPSEELCCTLGKLYILLNKIDNTMYTEVKLFHLKEIKKLVEMANEEYLSMADDNISPIAKLAENVITRKK